MTKRRLIGYATTNSNGVATLNYVGQGLGEVDIVAETGGEMLFSDVGTSGTGYTNFYNYASFNPSVDSTGTLLTYTTSSTANYYANIGATSDLFDFQAPFSLEFDIVSFSGTVGTQIKDINSDGAFKTFSQLGITGACHLKISVTSSKITYQVDDNEPIEQSYSVNNARVSITINNGTLKYKNFFIYRGSSSLVSQPVKVFDYGLIYVGTDNTQASSWYNYNSYLTVDYNSDGTRVRHTENSTDWRYLYFNDSTITTEKVGGYYAIPNNYCVEFDVTAITDSEITINLSDGTNNPLAQINRNGHYKLVMNGSICTLTKDGTTNISFSPSNVLNGNYVRFAFGFNAYNEGIRFKNFMIYPI